MGKAERTHRGGRGGMRLLDRLRQLPPEALVPVGWVIDELENQAPEPREWVGTVEAAERLDIPERTMRDRVRRYSEMDNPPIRVRQDKPGSPWLVAADDLPERNDAGRDVARSGRIADSVIRRLK